MKLYKKIIKAHRAYLGSSDEDMRKIFREYFDYLDEDLNKRIIPVYINSKRSEDINLELHFEYDNSDHDLLIFSGSIFYGTRMKTVEYIAHATPSFLNNFNLEVAPKGGKITDRDKISTLAGIILKSDMTAFM